MPGQRLQLTRTLEQQSNRAVVHRVAEPQFRVETAADASDDAVAAVKAFFEKHNRDAKYTISQRRSRQINTGISIMHNNEIVVHLPKTATKSLASRRLSAALTYDPLYPMLHQRVAAKEWNSVQPQTYMLYFSMGSGKTAGTLNMLALMDPPPNRVLIVCSNTMIGHWVKEIYRTSQYQGETTFYIVGYTEFRRMVGTEPSRFISRRYDVVVVDEAHYYRNLTPAMRTDVHTLRQAKRLVLLTGTPIQNDVSEVHGMLVLLGLRGDETLAEAEKTLKARNAVFYYDPSVHGSAFTQSAYPDLHTVIEKVPMDPDQTLEYLMCLRKNTRIGPYTVSTSRCNSYNSLTRAISNTMGEGKMSPKFDRIVKNVTANSKYRGPHVVYSHYRPKGVEAVEKVLSKGKYGLRTALMTGSTDGRQRDALIRSYNEGEIDVFFITDAAREGIDLQGTGTMHLVEPHENVHTEMQTQSRVARHNSHTQLPDKDRKVTIVKYITTFPTVRATDRKRLERHMDEKYQLDATDFDIVKEVNRMIDDAGETIDEQYEHQNIAKAREIRPWIDMLHRIGTRKDAVGATNDSAVNSSSGRSSSNAAAKKDEQPTKTLVKAKAPPAAKKKTTTAAKKAPIVKTTPAASKKAETVKKAPAAAKKVVSATKPKPKSAAVTKGAKRTTSVAANAPVKRHGDPTVKTKTTRITAKTNRAPQHGADVLTMRLRSATRGYTD